jgi:diphosphomevalonate decarboxylase
MSWSAHAPSNIALIKYMGKKPNSANLPDNPSLSYTLNNLQTHVSMESITGSLDIWEPLSDQAGCLPLHLNDASQLRYLAHLAKLKAYFNYTGGFIVRSANTFPEGTGLASSASSFAALTLCAAEAMSELLNKPMPSIEVLADLSRQGSGSSCRSFFSPWALWDDDTVEAIELPYTNLVHHVIIINAAEKKVSSSQAHQQIKTSKAYAKRPERAKKRLAKLIDAFNDMNWKQAYQICYEEFQDMHQLFNTCEQPFSYITPECEAVLKALCELWEKHDDGPLITMDAGPNIHLLFRPDQAEWMDFIKNDPLMSKYALI